MAFFIKLLDERKILIKLQAIAGKPQCGAVCTNCFEKCTFWFADKDDLRNVPRVRFQEVLSLLTSTEFAATVS